MKYEICYSRYISYFISYIYTLYFITHHSSLKMKPLFITGIGTGVGKTVVSAIVTEALEADYWKPIQAGFDDGTDALQVKELITNTKTIIHPEVYKLQLPASPHIAARMEGIEISLKAIVNQSPYPPLGDGGIIEGAGGIMVPLNDNEFMVDLIVQLGARVLLVSRNYLGSINHSLLTAAICKQRNINVVGWIFNDQYLDYEEEIVRWTGYPKIASIPLAKKIDKAFVLQQSGLVKEALSTYL